MTETIIDGSILEGGGQIIRISLALAALLRKKIRIVNIRGRRPKPGLRAQHLHGVRLVQQLAGGQLTGDQLYSTELCYDPPSSDFQGENEDFLCEIPTNGATTLLAQIALPVALFRQKQTRLDLKGGTNADFAPPIEYYQSVFLAHLERLFKIQIECKVLKYCYNFPQGGGHIRLKVQPAQRPLQAINLVLNEADEFQVDDISIIASTAGKVARRVADQMSSAASDVLRKTTRIDTRHHDHNKAAGNGSFVFIKANISKDSISSLLATSSQGSPKESPKETGRRTASALLKQLDDKSALVDEYAQDQLIIFMALAAGKSRLQVGQELTLHTQTAMHIVELLTSARFEIVSNIIECQGIGFFPKRIIH